MAWFQTLKYDPYKPDISCRFKNMISSNVLTCGCRKNVWGVKIGVSVWVITRDHKNPKHAISGQFSLLFPILVKQLVLNPEILLKKPKLSLI